MDEIIHERCSFSGGADGLRCQPTPNHKDFPASAGHIKILCVAYGISLAQVDHVLSACRGTIELAFWVNVKKTTKITKMISTFPLRRLSIERDHFSRLPTISSLSSDCHWFKHLTHLELVFWDEALTAVVPSSLNTLACLSNVCLTLGSITADEYCARLAEAFIAECQQLRVIAISCHHDDSDMDDSDMSSFPALADMRERSKVPILFIVYTPPLRQWEWGGTTAWDIAETQLRLSLEGAFQVTFCVVRGLKNSRSRVRFGWFRVGTTHTNIYRVMCPVFSYVLLLSGRCISCSHSAVIPRCSLSL